MSEFDSGAGWRNKLLLTDAEVRQVLGCGRSFLQEERQAGRISYIQSGPSGRVMYRPEFIDEYLSRHTHRAKPVPQSPIGSAGRPVRR